MSGGDDGSLGIYVKDAPLDEYGEVRVTFTRAEVLPEQASDWVTVYDGETTIDLLGLQGSTAKAKLAQLGVTPGKYEGLRLAISDAIGVAHNGTQEPLIVSGNVLSVLESFEIGKGADLSLLVDFDLNASAEAPGLFEPHAKNLQSSAHDHDSDGVDDVADADDDGDGVEDAKDHDRDGDGKPDAPRQDRGNLFGLCTAWMASETGRLHANATANRTAFERLSANATAAGQSVEAYCDAQPFPGKSDAIPEDAMDAREAAQARRSAARNETAAPGAPGSGTHGAPSGGPTQTPAKNETHGAP